MYTTRVLDQLRDTLTRLANAARTYDVASDGPSGDAEHHAANVLADTARTAVAAFDALDAALCSEQHLPDPWSQCRPDRRCNHDAPALRDVSVFACECGALLVDDTAAEAERREPARARLDYGHARRFFYAATGIAQRDLETQDAALWFAMNGTDGHGRVLYNATRLAAWCNAWRAINHAD